MTHQASVTALLSEAPFAVLRGRNGFPQPAWKNPGLTQFADAVRRASNRRVVRCIVTERDIFVWQGDELLHDDFIAQTGIGGVKIRLVANEVVANWECVVAPEECAWVFAGIDVDALDMEERREIVESWLRADHCLPYVYGNDFTIRWYM